MKFLILSAFAEDGRESGANRLRKLRYGLQSLGHECSWLGPVDGFILAGAKKKALASWHLFQQARQWSRENQDGLLLVSLPPPWLLPVALLLAVVSPKRLIVDFRDPILNQRINSRGFFYRFILGTMEALLVRRARLVIVAAGRIRDHLAPSSRKPVTVLAGLDERELLETAGASMSRNRTNVVYGGTFYGSRSPQLLLQAIAADTGKLTFEFYVSFNDEAEEAAVRTQITAMSLEKRVRFFPQVARPLFLEKLRSAGAGLIITHSEGSDYAIPGKIYDYLTAGVLPWVISRDPGLIEFLQENKVKSLVTDGWERVALLKGIQALEQKLAEGGGGAFSPDMLSVKSQAAVLVDSLRADS